MSVKYEVDYNDPRLKSVRDGEADELKESDAMYDSMISDTKGQYDKLIDAADKNAKTQTELQQERTDFTISQIEQQKEQSEKDYQKEQSAAYTNYQKQIDPYGVNAEQMAAQGMSGSGYSESSKVRMYNAYQQRVAVARDVAERAKVEYDNAMTEARLQNSSALAEIAAATYETQLKLSLESFQQQNSLILQKVNAQKAIKTKYDNKWLDVLDQINTENALSEEARQFDILHPQNEVIIKDENEGFDNADTGTASISKSSSAIKEVSGGDASSTQTTTNKNESKDDELPIDFSSIMALGYGVINATQLDKLIREGKVVEYKEDGKLKYRKNITKGLMGLG